MKLVDKAAMMAEIEKRYEYWREKEFNSHSIESEIRMSECQYLMLLLNNLEVKGVDVDLEKEIINHIGDEGSCKSGKWTWYECNEMIHYFFELGIKATQKEVNLEKEIKDYFNNQPIITRSKGIDYQFIPSNEDIAKHFFELGLKAQKGK